MTDGPPPLRVVIVDMFGALADAVTRQMTPTASTALRVVPYTDIATLPRPPGTAFVSPANSFGFMDGGVDFVLSRIMFPGVEAAVRAEIRRRGKMTLLGRPYLDIGEAIVVPAGAGHDGVFLVSAPTMWFPQDVSLTRNAYCATRAALQAAEQHGAIDTVVFPGMCTGCGAMTAHEAASQMLAAIEEHGAQKRQAWRADPEQIARAQPDFYKNTEFKRVRPGDVVVHPLAA